MNCFSHAGSGRTVRRPKGSSNMRKSRIMRPMGKPKYVKPSVKQLSAPNVARMYGRQRKYMTTNWATRAETAIAAQT